MPTLQHIEYLFEELGPATPEIEAVFRESETQWMVMFDETLGFTADFSEECQKLLFACGCGSPPEESRLAAYETLLLHNGLWEQTHGVTFSLDAPGGEIFLQFELPAANLEIALLQGTLLNLAEKARFWREAIPLGLDANSLSDTMAFEPSGSALRV